MAKRRPGRSRGRAGAALRAKEKAAIPIFNADPLARVAQARELFWHNILRELLTSLSMVAAERVSAAAASAAAGAKAGAVTSAADGTAPARTGEAGAASESEGSMLLRGAMGATSRKAGSPKASGEEEEDEEADGEGEAGEEKAGVSQRIVVGGHEVPATIGRDPGNIFDGRLGVITAWGQRIPIGHINPVFACGLPSKDGENWLSTAVECTVFEITTPAGEVFTLPLSHVVSFHSLSEELLKEIERVLRRGGRGGEEKEEPFGFAAFTSLARSRGGLGAVPEISREYLGE